jgi:hypothetical protein
MRCILCMSSAEYYYGVMGVPDYLSHVETSPPQAFGFICCERLPSVIRVAEFAA